MQLVSFLHLLLTKHPIQTQKHIKVLTNIMIKEKPKSYDKLQNNQLFYRQFPMDQLLLQNRKKLILILPEFC